MIALTHKQLAVAVGIIVLAIVGGVGGLALAAYITTARSVATADTVKADTQAEIGRLKQTLAEALAKIQADKRDVQTPQQIVVKIPEYLPGLPVAPQVTHVPSVQGDQGAHPLPDAPSALSTGGIYFPPADVKPLFDHLADCKADQAKLAECKAEVPLLEKRAETAERAMKGGGFWSRLKHDAKTIVITGAVAGAIGYAAHR
jgi:hypothetical protein